MRAEAPDAVIIGLRRNAEDLLREHGTDVAVRGLKGLASFIGSRILGTLPKDAGYRRKLEVPLDSATFVHIETVDRGIPSAAPRIDIVVGPKSGPSDLFFDRGTVIPSDHKFIGVDLEHRGTRRYFGFGGSIKDSSSIPLEQATRYQEALSLAKTRLVLAA